MEYDKLNIMNLIDEVVEEQTNDALASLVQAQMPE